MQPYETALVRMQHIHNNQRSMCILQDLGVGIHNRLFAPKLML
jgi:hypothetical protein